MKEIIGGIVGVVCASFVFADTININNNPGSPVQQSACPNANQNNIYDPRVPPAGAYVIQNQNGSSEQLYTTGEKKPYIVDNNCNTNSAAVQPNVIVTPRGR